MGEGLGTLPFHIVEVGRGWGTDPATRQSEETDLVEQGIDKQSHPYCECKWRNKPVRSATLEGPIE